MEYEQGLLAAMRGQTGYRGNVEGLRAFVENEYRPGLEAYDFRKTEKPF